jgi:hypothetical protein
LAGFTQYSSENAPRLFSNCCCASTQSMPSAPRNLPDRLSAANPRKSPGRGPFDELTFTGDESSGPEPIIQRPSAAAPAVPRFLVNLPGSFLEPVDT